jgi:hypothetical protein
MLDLLLRGEGIVESSLSHSVFRLTSFEGLIHHAAASGSIYSWESMLFHFNNTTTVIIM